MAEIEKLKRLQKRLMDLSLKYWELQESVDKSKGKFRSAVKWVRDDITRQTIVITRGEYSKQITDFIDSL